MRRPLAIMIALFAFSACETSPLGGRCTQNTDCDRSSTPTAQCVNMLSPHGPCGGLGSSCVCCPISGDSGVLGCGPMMDSGVLDTNEGGAMETAVDSAPQDTGCFPPDVPDADVMDPPCPMGMYRPYMGTCGCMPQFSLGHACQTDNACQSGHCASGVCCISPCNQPGLSCNVSAALAGECLPASFLMDASPGG